MTLLAIYFIFILHCRNDVRQKANLSNSFYSSSKWVVSGGDNSHYQPAFGPGTANEHTVQFKNFAKETRKLKMRSTVTGHQKLTTTIESNHQS